MTRSLAVYPLAILAIATAAAQPAPPGSSDRPTVQAVRVPDGSIRLDGRLGDAAWDGLPVASGFRQVEPEAGAPARLPTEVRIAFDSRALYVGAVMTDTLGTDGLRVRDLRRDFDYFDNDHVSVTLDPFGDRRNAVAFQVSPYGALRDLQVRDGVDFNRDWDGVWDARTVRSDSGWTVEIAIPWATLRYPASGVQTWGLQLSRNGRRVNELSAWSPWPRQFNTYTMAFAGTLTGIEPPPPGRNLRVQPYVLTEAGRLGDAPFSDDAGAQVGGDLKWAVTPTTVLDLTVNTDFAQADADQQVVNLTRFSVFFPERRAFFLESADVFDVGASDNFTPFYSRRIGLDAGRPIGLDGGARLVTGGAWGRAGALGVRQRSADGVPAAWFGVGRASLNVGAENRIGGMVVARHNEALGATLSDSGAEPASGEPSQTNTVAVVDGFSRLGRTGAVSGYAAASATSGDGGEGIATQVWVRNSAMWGYVGFIQQIATADYEAATGFVFRRDVLYNGPAVFLDLRPGWLPASVRSYAPRFVADIFHRPSDGAFLQANTSVTPLRTIFQSGAEASAFVRPTWQELDVTEAGVFRPLGAELAAGSYRYVQVGAALTSDPSRRITGSVEVSTGGYFDGRLTTVEATASAAPSPRLAVALRYELNDARRLGVDALDVRSHLLGANVRVALSPRLQATAFWQYNSLADLASLNARVSWEFAPLSFVYLVVNDSRFYVPTTDRMAMPDAFLSEQQGVLKVTYLRQL
ncbi:MAG: DUF5916 domain-containing protein [Bacteroidota bacterium]